MEKVRKSTREKKDEVGSRVLGFTSYLAHFPGCYTSKFSTEPALAIRNS